jgi:hypothetical protein
LCNRIKTVAEKALQSLKRVRAGITAGKKKRDEKGRKRIRQQMSELFTSNKKRSLVRAVLLGNMASFA